MDSFLAPILDFNNDLAGEFSFKPDQDTFGVHSRFNDFEGNSSLNRLLLFGHINHAAAAFANLLQQFVSANSVTRFFAKRSLSHGFRLGRGLLQKIASLIVYFQQLFDPLAQFGISATSTLQEGAALGGRQLEGFRKQHYVPFGGIIHELMRDS